MTDFRHFIRMKRKRNEIVEKCGDLKELAALNKKNHNVEFLTNLAAPKKEIFKKVQIRWA